MMRGSNQITTHLLFWSTRCTKRNPAGPPADCYIPSFQRSGYATPCNPFVLLFAQLPWEGSGRENHSSVNNIVMKPVCHLTAHP